MTLKQQGLLAGSIFVIGLISTVAFGSDLAPPRFHAFGYSLHHVLGFGLGIYLSALPDASALMWIIGRTCRTNNGRSLHWPAFVAAVILFVGLTTLIQVRIHPLMTSEWLMVVVIARLFAFFGAALLWAIPFQLWAVKNAQAEPQTLESPSEEKAGGAAGMRSPAPARGQSLP